LFVLNKNHVLGICDRLIERHYDLNIWAYARVDTLHAIFLKKLRAAGFQWLGIGIESGSKYVRDGTSKGKIRQSGHFELLAAVRALKASMCPRTTSSACRTTMSPPWRRRCRCAGSADRMGHNMLFRHGRTPDRPLYGLAKDRGWLLPDDDGGPGWIGYSQHSYHTLPVADECAEWNRSSSITGIARSTVISPIRRTSTLCDLRFGEAAVSISRKMTTVKLVAQVPTDEAGVPTASLLKARAAVSKRSTGLPLQVMN
jgi:hypothetical protein